MQDLAVIYYTANFINEDFATNIKDELVGAIKMIPLIVVSQKPVEIWGGENIVVGEIGRSHLNIYRQALTGAKAAKTKYIALVEDDVLYTPDHFKFRPKQEDVFYYNMNVWAIYTWDNPPFFSYKDRRNLSQLICNRELFIEAMEERFAKYPDDSKTPIESWAEPGKYEDNLGITQRKSDKFYSENPNVAFSHETALSFLNLGKRKAHGNIKALAIPYWGKAENVIKLYQ